ncbi:MAG TPA: hypothetical protein DEG86_00805 [Halieaceae bacterium]|nr:hypothetical protein [Halieaceae bacterium]
MTSPNEPVQPTPFSVAQPVASEVRNSGQASSESRWLIPALLFLVACALAVVFWLPSQLGSEPGAPAAPAESSPAPVGQTPAMPAADSAEPAASPWSDAQQARLRTAAQDVLAQLVELQFGLEERGAAVWARAELEKAKAAAGRGDALYQTREFVAATEAYRDSLTQLQAIEATIPAVLQNALDSAAAALETGDAQGLEPALATATLLAPDDPTLAQLRDRAAAMAPLQAALDQAQALESAGDLAGAEATLQTATQLDPASQRAARALTRVQAAHATQRYQRAMSEGYSALDEGRFDAAASAFASARKLQPDNPEIDAAVTELRSTQSAARLSALQRTARNHEAKEAWGDAVASYEEALAVDATLVFAQEGLARAQPRARLDTQLREALAAPERLADPAVARSLEQLLSEARGVTPAGDTLAQQIGQLAQLLERANTPVTVTLRSDQLTAVLVQRVTRLGQFSEQRLTLRPGEYTAVGTREGYRDVRETFTVSADQVPPPIFIACTDPV